MSNGFLCVCVGGERGGGFEHVSHSAVNSVKRDNLIFNLRSRSGDILLERFINIMKVIKCFYDIPIRNGGWKKRGSVV